MQATFTGGNCGITQQMTNCIDSYLFTGATGSQGALNDTGLNYNPSTGTLTSVKFIGDGSGLTGVTASGSGIV